MTESSGFPLRRDHPLARVFDDSFALPDRCDCACEGNHIMKYGDYEVRTGHAAGCPGPKRNVEDPTNQTMKGKPQ
jgi:hypothetical protein